VHDAVVALLHPSTKTTHIQTLQRST
jgi:hypothetical protein